MCSFELTDGAAEAICYADDFLILQAHFLLDLAEALNHEVDVLLGMAGGELGANPILALGNHRVAEGHNVDALLKHPAGELMGNLGIIEHDGNNGVLAGQQLEAQLFHFGAEVASVLMDLVTQGSGALQQIQGCDGGGADGGGDGVGEEVGTALLVQQIHDGLTGSSVAA